MHPRRHGEFPRLSARAGACIDRSDQATFLALELRPRCSILFDASASRVRAGADRCPAGVGGRQPTRCSAASTRLRGLHLGPLGGHECVTHRFGPCSVHADAGAV
ncbi:hypothetical protein CH272_23790 [Rhodococcus sp. 05-340-1]|nr:hypothetical protein CH271_14460 [Rhodococcus sp. 05-340-2]OZD71913.1 hypothetical protein CH272_23790 [Rhodococcus sp. 05-340-1]OZF34354.1 hypothetical protein CH295_11005 [Rhodococcus sp. 14-2483-1-2]